MSETAPIYCVTGPPAAGKTTFSVALASRFDRALHLEVDRLRTSVIQGLADSVPWSEETERQFQIAEAAACAVARTYADAGFTVILDHCRNLERWDAFVTQELAAYPVTKICLLPALDVVLQRNGARTNKDFDPAILDETIRFTHGRFSSGEHPDWLFLMSNANTPDQNVQTALTYSKPGP